MLSSARAIHDAINDQGFAAVHGVFDAREIDCLAEDLAGTPLARSRAGARHAMRSPVVAHLARDARLLSIARSVLGEAALPYRATLFDKSPDSNWRGVNADCSGARARRRIGPGYTSVRGR
jgi:hypothetical protein